MDNEQSSHNKNQNLPLSNDTSLCLYQQMVFEDDVPFIEQNKNDELLKEYQENRRKREIKQSKKFEQQLYKFQCNDDDVFYENDFILYEQLKQPEISKPFTQIQLLKQNKNSIPLVTKALNPITGIQQIYGGLTHHNGIYEVQEQKDLKIIQSEIKKQKLEKYKKLNLKKDDQIKTKKVDIDQGQKLNKQKDNKKKKRQYKIKTSVKDNISSFLDELQQDIKGSDPINQEVGKIQYQGKQLESEQKLNEMSQFQLSVQRQSIRNDQTEEYVESDYDISYPVNNTIAYSDLIFNKRQQQFDINSQIDNKSIYIKPQFSIGGDLINQNIGSIENPYDLKPKYDKLGCRIDKKKQNFQFQSPKRQDLYNKDLFTSVLQKYEKGSEKQSNQMKSANLYSVDDSISTIQGFLRNRQDKSHFDSYRSQTFDNQSQASLEEVLKDQRQIKLEEDSNNSKNYETTILGKRSFGRTLNNEKGLAEIKNNRKQIYKGVRFMNQKRFLRIRISKKFVNQEKIQEIQNFINGIVDKIKGPLPLFEINRVRVFNQESFKIDCQQMIKNVEEQLKQQREKIQQIIFHKFDTQQKSIITELNKTTDFFQTLMGELDSNIKIQQFQLNLRVPQLRVHQNLPYNEIIDQLGKHGTSKEKVEQFTKFYDEVFQKVFTKLSEAFSQKALQNNFLQQKDLVDLQKLCDQNIIKDLSFKDQIDDKFQKIVYWFKDTYKRRIQEKIVKFQKAITSFNYRLRDNIDDLGQSHEKKRPISVQYIKSPSQKINEKKETNKVKLEEIDSQLRIIPINSHGVNIELQQECMRDQVQKEQNIAENYRNQKQEDMDI